MKIGILTYYGDLNCGTNLQAYATLQAVKSVYPNDAVEIIPFHGFDPQMIRPYKSFQLISILKDFRRIYKYYSFKKKHLQITGKDTIQKNVLKALQYISDRKYDVIYIGADTLLELDKLPKGYNGLSAYWLKDIKAKKILIAASSKNIEYEKLSSNQKKEMETAVCQFAYMGVRDRNTKILLSHIVTEKQIEYIPDPAFTLEINYSYIENYLKRKCLEIPQKSILIHHMKKDSYCTVVSENFKRQGYKIFAFRPVRWADYCLNDLSPFEQLGIYRYFEFVITFRFHDCIFCLKNNTPLLVYEAYNLATSKGESKLTSLLKDFDLLSDCYLGNSSEITVDSISKKQVHAITNFQRKNDTIKNMVQIKKNEYLNYLKKTLQ